MIFSTFLTLLSTVATVAAADSLNGETQAVAAAQEKTDTSALVLTLEDALKIAMSENVSVKIADKEVTRMTYAKRGAYAALYPQIDGSVGMQENIQLQKMYINEQEIRVGYQDNFSTSVTAAMPLVNASLWQSLKISKDEVELAVEKARSSRLDMVTEVKNAYYTVLWARDALAVYEKVYDNAKRNLEVTTMKYNAQKASEMDYVRAKTTVANAVPDVYNSRNLVDLSLWKLKAVIGLPLDSNIDVKGSLADFANSLFFDLHEHDDMDISRNSSLKQLDIQIGELARTVKMNEYAYIPTLSLAFNYTYTGMGNNFNFAEYRWTPYSYVGLSLKIPIFSGMKRWNDVKQSKVQHAEMLLQRTDLERQLKITVKSCLGTMETGMKSYYAAQSAVESAQKSYDISSKSYEVGRSTLVELNDALLALSQAELMQWQAVYNFLEAKSTLEQQLGQDYLNE